MMFCPNCGIQNPNENLLCIRCRAPLHKPLTIPTATPLPSKYETPTPKKPNKYIKYIVMISVFFVILILLVASHIICINHDWNAPNCIEPAQCRYCNKYKDNVLGNHNWMDATCSSPRTCFYCDAEEGKPLGHNWAEAPCGESAKCQRCGEIGIATSSHIKSDWVVTKEATLVTVGVEEIICTVCGESLDSRGTERKNAKVIGTSFNFTDKELIDWLNDIAKFDIGYTNMNDSSDMNTMYYISYEGETGGLILNHGNNGKNGNVCAIMVYFNDWSTSVVIAAWIGDKIDSDFSGEDSFVPISNGKVYTEADMSLVDVDDIIVLTPTEHLAEILD